MKIIVILMVIWIHDVKADLNTNEHLGMITLAVGHDHQKMLEANYPIYRANWQFISHSLNLIGYEVTAVAVPWARAKHLTQTGKSDGLFIAANFAGREKWAILSKPIGYGIFGAFLHIERKTEDSIIAVVRLGDHDKVLSKFHPKDLFEVATAQEGFRLLFNKRIDRFVMSESYGNYLLDTELSNYRDKLRFDSNFFEKRSLHIAFAKDNKRSRKVLKVVNQAITLGLNNGLYQQAMQHYKVPERMQYTADM